MAGEGFYRPVPYEQRPTETWDGPAATFSMAYECPQGGQQTWSADIQPQCLYGAVGVAPGGPVHGLPSAAPVPDREGYLSMDFRRSIHQDQGLSRLSRSNGDRYAFKAESMSLKLLDTFGTPPFPIVPSTYERTLCCDGSTYELVSKDTCTSYDQPDDADSPWFDQGDCASERVTTSPALQTSSHLFDSHATRVADHTYFGPPRNTRGDLVGEDFAQPGGVYSLQCACGLQLNGSHAKGNLTRHQRSRACTAYAETRKCKCPECHQVFWRSDALLNHRRKKHEAPPCRPNRLRRHKR